MAKFTLAVAALVALSVAGTRVQAQSEQLASVDQASIEQPAIEQPAIEQPVIEQPVIEQTVAGPDAQAPAAVDLSVPSGPSLQASELSPRLATETAQDANTMRRPSRGSGVGLMILGGAALVTGLIIGNDAGTVIAVGGAVIGLYGLYVYLGRPTGVGQNNRIGLGYKLNTH